MSTRSKIDALKAERTAINARLREIEQELSVLIDRRHAEDLRALVGTPGAVKLRFLHHSDPRAAARIGAPATLVEVRRTRCSIEFADSSRWNVQIGDIVPVEHSADTAVVQIGGAE